MNWRAIGNAPGLSSPSEQDSGALDWYADCFDAERAEIARYWLEGEDDAPEQEVSDREAISLFSAALGADNTRAWDQLNHRYLAFLEGLNSE